jgi:hypothetical protein
LRDEHRLRVFENRMLRSIFGPKREEEGSRRKLRNDELHDLYSSPNMTGVIKARRMRWAGHVARKGEGDIKMDLRERGIDGENWIQLAQDRVQWGAFVNTVMNLRVL